MAAKPLPFDEAIQFHRDKVNMPTQAWTDLNQGMHSRAFAVAGAMKEALLADFHSAIDKALASGTTLAEFRQDFDNIVKRHGWSYNGSAGWRSKVIYQTNLSTAYQAGRYKQMLDPDVIKRRPYMQYHHGGSKDPRPDHLSWDGLVLPFDDPFWKTHRPKNGWGCKCYVTSHSKKDLELMGKTVPDTSPTVNIDPNTNLPEGIDKGWNYDLASSSWGLPLSKQSMQAWKDSGHEAWERLTPGNWQSYDLQQYLPVKNAKAKLGDYVKDKAALQKQVEKVLGAPEKVLRTPTGAPVLVNAETLADHIDISRAPYVNYLPELIEKPQEVWISFQRHKGTGKVEMRQRLIRLVEDGNKNKLILVAQASGGMFEAWTFIPTNRQSYINKQREGFLLYAEGKK